jgi:hypothetical protein
MSGAILGGDVADVDGNGSIGWVTAKAAGMSFVILRASESTTPDKDFKVYRAGARAAGIQTGAYMFLRFPTTQLVHTAQPEVQVDAFLDVIGTLYADELPPTIDLELPSGRGALSAQQVLDWFLRAHRYLKAKLGYAPMTYTSYVFWVDPAGLANLPAPELADTPLWVKYWPWKEHTVAQRDPAVIGALPAPPCPSPWNDAWMAEQYQGDAIKWPGFVSTMDCDRWHVLRQGDKNPTVGWAQRRLGGLVVDDIFGPATEARVMAFQKEKGLRVDGVIGNWTFAPLARSNPS